MKNTLTLIFCLISIFSVAQSEISFKAGINPTFMDHQWGASGNYATFKGGWGYKTGFDFSYRISKRWAFFHGIGGRISKYQFYQSMGTDYFIEQGIVPMSLYLPIGAAYKFRMLNREAELRGIFEYNVGIGGRTTTHSVTFAKNEWNKTHINYRINSYPDDNSFKLNRFEAGGEIKLPVYKNLALNVGYSYGLSDRMNRPPVSLQNTKSAGGHSLVIGFNWMVLKYK